ncbi:MAG: bifunctional hydroxymethylpyrimidine kinase/phosphomethylpyrimidine kinase [Dehalococcoidia bacterium]|jgi:hydroxymethylpyrimidine/phosphomethylpyrimidine kinase|nr:bifunctional hydroxymethylpyrimidine kinase/phosphomethylpyrimidine kinase [Dehalococcoidia bacterium]|tara:strand:+ start:13983 stop:14774 length:792 start_codon:yes stop_codon:yes gene_type:complete
MKIPVSMTIAGSDSGGGAGIQADLKTFSALGTFGCSVITAVTAQNTTGVYGIHEIPIDIIESQIDAVLDDLNPNVIKTGMLASIEVIQLISKKIKSSNTNKIVVDPVMIAKGGDKLIQDNAIGHLISELLPLSTVVTPNIPEAEVLSKMTINTTQDIESAAKIIHSMGPDFVVIKGGHSNDSKSNDTIYDGQKFTILEADRIPTANTHGTGCTYASAIAAGLAKNYTVDQSVEEAKNYVTQAIKNEPGLGKGHGPLNHFFMLS